MVKGISTVIATILMLMIVIALAGSAYMYISGVFTARTAEVFSIVDTYKNILIIRNDGTVPLRSISATLDGRRTYAAIVGGIVNPGEIKEVVIAPFMDTRSVHNLRLSTAGMSSGGILNYKYPDIIYKNEGVAIKDDCGRVWWIKSNGDGTFASPLRLPDLPSPDGCCLRAIDLNDFNNDGYLDIIAGARNGGDVLYIAKGKTDGTFEPWQYVARYWDSWCTMDFTSADFDQDGDIDLIVDGEWHVARFYRNRGDGTFDAPVDIPHTGGGDRGRDVGDFNGDGKLDFVAARCCDGLTYRYFGNGDGTFIGPTFIFDSGDDPYTVAAGDFNNDGKADLVTSWGWNGRHFFYKGNGDGTFQAGVFVFDMGDDVYGGGDAFDFNHDGNLDIVFNTWCNRKTYFARGLGNGQFATPVEIANTAGFSCTMAIAAPPIY